MNGCKNGKSIYINNAIYLIIQQAIKDQAPSKTKEDFYKMEKSNRVCTKRYRPKCGTSWGNSMEEGLWSQKLSVSPVWQLFRPLTSVSKTLNKPYKWSTLLINTDLIYILNYSIIWRSSEIKDAFKSTSTPITNLTQALPMKRKKI